jgi:hypothetical protein
MENPRRFEAGPDPFGRSWVVEFRWLQNAISIRHSDSVDVKFQLLSGEHAEEKVIALMHPLLLELCSRYGRPLSDPLCMRLAGAHIRQMILTDKDMDKELATPSEEELSQYFERIVERTPVRR